jgi:hypothetical protein
MTLLVDLGQDNHSVAGALMCDQGKSWLESAQSSPIIWQDRCAGDHMTYEGGHCCEKLVQSLPAIFEKNVFFSCSSCKYIMLIMQLNIAFQNHDWMKKRCLGASRGDQAKC